MSKEGVEGRLFSTETKRRAEDKSKRTIGEGDNIVLRLRNGKTYGGKEKKKKRTEQRRGKGRRDLLEEEKVFREKLLSKLEKLT